MAITDRIGYRSGRLTVICEATRDAKNRPRFICRCDCGNETTVIAANLLKAVSPTRSCGCLQRERASQTGAATVHDRIGERVGRLTVVGRGNAKKRVSWLCSCECGGVAEVLSCDLMIGKTESCGCLRKENIAEVGRQSSVHGHARGGKNEPKQTTPTYRSWASMHQRCTNPKAPNYHLYGGRGIVICDRWLGKGSFVNFLADMGERPIDTTLDRVDSNGNYEPSNCRWSDAKTQSQNRRSSAEYDAVRRKNLDIGRRRMWADPEIRERLLQSRRKQKS